MSGASFGDNGSLRAEKHCVSADKPGPAFVSNTLLFMPPRYADAAYD